VRHRFFAGEARSIAEKLGQLKIVTAGIASIRQRMQIPAQAICINV